MRISVVIPVWNDADLLERCLAAVREQTRQPDEIVVVDNNSSDKSAAVALAHGARVVKQPVQGIAPASAAGFDAASGDYFARLDADSVPPVDWLARLERLALSEGALTVVTGPGHFYDSGAVRAWIGRYIYLGGFFRGLSVMLGHSPIFGSNFMMSSELWQRVRGSVHTVADIHDDIDLSYQLQPDMAVRYVPSLVVGISGRPLASPRALYRRARWVNSTLSLDFKDQSPVRRLRARRRWTESQSVS